MLLCKMFPACLSEFLWSRVALPKGNDCIHILKLQCMAARQWLTKFHGSLITTMYGSRIIWSVLTLSTLQNCLPNLKYRSINGRKGRAI